MDSNSVTPDKYNLDTDTLNSIYDWVDQVQLSRPKRNIARDFSDAGINLIYCFFYLQSLKCIFIFYFFMLYI